MENKIEFIGKSLLVNVGELRVLVIGDLHLGYEEVLNKSGVLVGRKLFGEMLSDFEKIFLKVGSVDKIVLLGDVKHEFGKINSQEWGDALKIFEYLGDKCNELIVIKGNHDNMLQGIAKQRDIILQENYILGGVAFLHGNKDFPEIYEKEVRMWIMGHAHPAIKLTDRTKVERYKCFLEGKFEGKRVIVVPSFSEYSKGVDVKGWNDSDPWAISWGFDYDNFNVRVVGEDLEVLDFGKLKNLD